jgi:hypothetical protein
VRNITSAEATPTAPDSTFVTPTPPAQPTTTISCNTPAAEPAR